MSGFESRKRHDLTFVLTGCLWLLRGKWTESGSDRSRETREVVTVTVWASKNASSEQGAGSGSGRNALVWMDVNSSHRLCSSGTQR